MDQTCFERPFGRSTFTKINDQINMTESIRMGRDVKFAL